MHFLMHFVAVGFAPRKARWVSGRWVYGGFEVLRFQLESFTWCFDWVQSKVLFFAQTPRVVFCVPSRPALATAFADDLPETFHVQVPCRNRSKSFL